MPGGLRLPGPRRPGPEGGGPDALLRQAGAAEADGVLSDVSNFRTTADEIAYDRQVPDALGGPARPGAVIDTSRNGNGALPDGRWCDPPGRKIGRAPTLDTGKARIGAYLWVTYDLAGRAPSPSASAS